MEKVNSFVFKEETHEYFLDDLKIPNVSEILRFLSDIEYSDVSESILDNAKERGTEIHMAIELYNKYGFANIREEYKGYFEAYQKWYNDFKPDKIESEIMTYHKALWYSGTADLIVNDNILIDIKTTAQLNLKYVPVQNSAYRKALETHGYKIDKMFVLHLKSNGDYSFVELEDKFNIFLACLTVKNYIGS